jgi:5'-methylthioadenosine phosphorylase
VAGGIPRTPFALLSGSAGWGLKFPDDLAEPGVRVAARGLAFETPWGPTDNWQVIEFDGRGTADGRPRLALNVFSHGWPRDAVDHAVHRKVFWVLAQAGVRKVIADSTCGSLNRALQPRDYIVTSDVIDLGQTPYSTLPGRFVYLCRGAQLFCPQLMLTVEEAARELWPPGGRVYGRANRIVTAHSWGPRLESPAEARALALLGADAANQSMAPEATNAREIGACFASGSYVVNYVDGVIPEEWGALDRIHDELGAVAARISLRTVARAELSGACGCAAYRTARPGKYRTAAQSESSAQE